MAKILVFQHVPYEPLGTLDPLLRKHKHRIRYVNFGRNPKARPRITGYDALILLGGPMNIGEESIYPHLEREKQSIREARAMNIPVLGICLGAQLIASALGAKVYRAANKEIGWHPLTLTSEGEKDPVVKAIGLSSKIFQWHEYTFDLPTEAKLLVKGEQCVNQAFRIDEKIYGFQFHLEADSALIHRWLNLPLHQNDFSKSAIKKQKEVIWKQTLYEITRNMELGHQVFGAFLSQLPRVKKRQPLLHRQHAEAFTGAEKAG